MNSLALAVGFKYIGKVGAPPALSLLALRFLLMSAFCHLLIVAKAEIYVLCSGGCKSNNWFSAFFPFCVIFCKISEEFCKRRKRTLI